MKVTTVGTSHGLQQKTRRWSCQVLEINGYYYVIDAGADVAYWFIEKGLDINKIRCFFITHPHKDHVGGLASAVATINGYYREAETKFLLPNEAVKTFALFLVEQIAERPSSGKLSFEIYKEGVIYSDENLRVTAIPTQHKPYSYAFMVEAEGKKLLFTGDLHGYYIDMPKVAFDGSLDFILCECAHQPMEIVEEVFPKIKSKKFVLTHIGRRFPLSTLTEYRERSGVWFDIAEDDDVFEIE